MSHTFILIYSILTDFGTHFYIYKIIASMNNLIKLYYHISCIMNAYNRIAVVCYEAHLLCCAAMPCIGKKYYSFFWCINKHSQPSMPVMSLHEKHMKSASKTQKKPKKKPMHENADAKVWTQPYSSTAGIKKCLSWGAQKLSKYLHYPLLQQGPSSAATNHSLFCKLRFLV